MTTLLFRTEHDTWHAQYTEDDAAHAAAYSCVDDLIAAAATRMAAAPRLHGRGSPALGRAYAQAAAKMTPSGVPTFDARG
ncbi:MAG TPA: hypothetical protein VE967_16510 [Gemmatimonadaceae bacterium]|nr:hypothetical protein [Gemmatimonadaceae bacterium]